MIASVYVVVLAAFLISAVLTWWMCGVARSRGIIDYPNARSSHSRPTPRGGGLAIVVASAGGVLGLSLVGVVDLNLAAALWGGGLPIAWVGFMDDRGSVSVRLRFFVHAMAAAWAIFMLDGLPPVQLNDRSIDLGIGGDILGAVAIVWALNLFNFMDGIDGIAASEATFISAAGASIAIAAGGSLAVPATALTVSAASFGFLIWNWPPAKIFMGDVGSGYLGYAIAILALAAARESPVAMQVWLILGGLFFADTTVTLLRRLLRGEPVYLAHRSHAYQWLARRWRSHKRMTVTAIVVNLLWLLPSALLVTAYPDFAGWILLGALVPVALAVLAAGAGRREGGTDS